MMDVVDRPTRSRMMSGIRGRNTQPEMIVRSFLHRAGMRFRLHRQGMAGRPDLVLLKYNTAVFVHGCFWHRHRGCRFATNPATNTKFWEAKFEENVARDRRVQAKLRKQGWQVLTVWECDLRPTTLNKIVRAIKSNLPRGMR